MRIKLLAVVFLITICVASSFASGKQYFNYNKFIQAIKTGSVMSVTIGEYSKITGVYFENGVEKEFESWHEEPANDALLIEILNENDVEIAIAEKGKRDFFADWFLVVFSTFQLLIPAISLVLIVMILRRIDRLFARPEDLTTFS